ncbi:hypothetical protein HPP92_024058 [Vanilla planifolia]|uniref:DUF641 domain-containing protein n=1 Tax=Vanilla planifolia TaxID=51239 RepID=A0A835UCX7_VANPL|nr:hypothetical protein HPP92_024058 [Vanilla planifolia]
MDSTRPPQAMVGSISKAFTKILRLRRAEDDDAACNPEISGKQGLVSGFSFGEGMKEMEILVANLFAGVSAVKAAYAELQLAQEPYDPDAIQSADLAVITELRRLIDIKQRFGKNHLGGPPLLASQIEEQSNLLKTYKITAKKLDSQLKSKNAEVVSLKSGLHVAEKRCRALEARLRPGRTLAGLDDLHLSGLNPTHFLTLLRYTVKSIRSFVKVLIHEMKSSDWDLDSAATAIHTDLPSGLNSNHRFFAFESYVSRVIFSDFQNQDFGIGGSLLDRRQLFAEFTELKYVKEKDCFFSKNSQFGMFCREKYLKMVHPKMEASLFGSLEQRAVVSSGKGYPETNFFYRFVEMARRVWLLHRLFFSFTAEEKGAIFEARRGSRFSEVCMKSVTEEVAFSSTVDRGGYRRATVGFTVQPGFRVGRTVIQCRVYLVYLDG